MSLTHWIDTPAALAEAIRQWQGRDWLTVDTEFLRIDTYRPKLCLVQIGDGRDAWVIDSIAISDLSPLFERLNDPATVKVFHAASQDLEIFAQLTGRCPAPIFDTQLAAALLGLGDQLGYAGLVEKRLGIVIDKSLSRTDWSKRPLRQPEIDYAAADVIHLATLYPPLRAALQALGREGWLLEDALRMAEPASYETRPEDAWKRLRGLARLEPRAQQLAARLASWRETQAQERNRPRGWIVEDEALYRLAERRPPNAEQLAALGVLQPKTLERHGARLLALLAEPLPEPVTALVLDERLSPEQKARLQRLQDATRKTAEDLQLPPGLLAPRAELEAVLASGAAAPVRALIGWRRKAVGEALLSALSPVVVT
ncbi:MAG: ribonuclease D [Stagnimonas sp.]|nr:ribonuclease D [Stagnimonas sp.]